MTQTISPVQTELLFDPQLDVRFQVREVCEDAAGLELARVAFDESYRAVAEKKFHHTCIKAYQLSAPGANILKQSCLSLGTDAGVHRGAINCTVDREAVLITASQAQLEKLLKKLRPQPFGLKQLGESIIRMRQRQKQLVQSRPIQLMAILNVTPDSFSDGGTLSTPEAAVEAARVALTAGAHILDVGGESTRPGAEQVPLAQEFERVIPAIEAIHQAFPEAMISVDTRKAAVAEAALSAGAGMVNDVSGLTWDAAMLPLVVQAGCPVVIMHSQGCPQTMQADPRYEDVVGEICGFFYRQVAKAVEAGVKLENLILDPGFGFGKTVAHNLALMRRLPEIASLGFPVLVGTSRKGFLTLGQGDVPVEDREALTAASLAMAVNGGARILRVHDVQRQGSVVRWLQALMSDAALV